MPQRPGIGLVPEQLGDETEHRRQLARAVNNAMVGKINAVGTVTLTASSTSTTLSDSRIGPASHISFEPTTASALTAKANLYTSAKGKGTATLTHTSNAATDQTFTYSVIG